MYDEHIISATKGVVHNYQTFQMSTNSRQEGGWVCHENLLVYKNVNGWFYIVFIDAMES